MNVFSNPELRFTFNKPFQDKNLLVGICKKQEENQIFSYKTSKVCPAFPGLEIKLVQ